MNEYNFLELHLKQIIQFLIIFLYFSLLLKIYTFFYNINDNDILF